MTIENTPHGRSRRWSARIAAAAAAAVAAVGVMVLAGWAAHLTTLIQLRPHLPAMARNCAACLVLCGVALWAGGARHRRWLGVACAGAVTVLSVLTILEFLTGIDAGIDEILGRSYLTVKILSKPIQPGELFALVEHYLESARTLTPP